MVQYSPEIAESICERLMSGESLRSVCRSEGMPTESAVRQWVLDNSHGFATQYMRARDIGYDAQAEQIQEIADDKSDDPRSRAVRIDARKWILAKMRPKRYGDRLELAGDKDNPLTVSWAEVIRERRAKRAKAEDGK